MSGSSAYVTVDPDLRFVVSSRLHEEFENGRVHCALHGRSLANVPDRLPDQQEPQFASDYDDRTAPPTLG